MDKEIEKDKNKQEKEEERINSLFEAEDELQKEILESRQEEKDYSIDFSSIEKNTVEWMPVTGGERKEDVLIFDLLDKGETKQVKIPWPEDVTDENEPLVRLAKMDNTPVYNIADIDEIPVIRHNGQLHPITLPVYERNDWKARLSSGRVLSFSIPSITNYFRHKSSQAAIQLINSGGYELKEKDGKLFFNVDDKFSTRFSMLLAVIFVLPTVVFAATPLFPVIFTFLFFTLHFLLFTLILLSGLLIYEDIRIVHQELSFQDDEDDDEEEEEDEYDNKQDENTEEVEEKGNENSGSQNKNEKKNNVQEQTDDNSSDSAGLIV